jgi:hypothetical protein
MVILRIEHKVMNFDGWKVAFDNDPIDRKKMGVKRYRIFRPADDPNYAIVDLEFDRLSVAETTLTALQKIWPKAEGTIMIGPQVRILNIIESKEY